MNGKIVCAFTAALFVLGTLFHPVAGQDEKLSLADLIEQTEPSCVRLDVKLRNGQAIGSGFIVNQSAWIVTNYHVIEGAAQITASFADGMKAEVAGFLAYDKKRDVAVLQIKTDRKARPLKLTTKVPRKGESSIAIGAPQGLSFTATEGIISAIRDGKELKEFGNDAVGTWLQTSTPISPGSSGGPLLNMKGEVVGANSGSLPSAQNLNFAISAGDIDLVIKTAERSQLQMLAKLEPPRTRPTPRPRPSADGEQIVCKLPAERRFKHRYKIGQEEDEFDKVVWLRTPWMPLKHNDPRLATCGLRVGVPYRENNPSPAVIWEVGTTAKSFAFIGIGATRFQLLYDGESAELNNPKHKGDVGRGGVAETLTTLFRLDGFLEVISAKEVKARVGQMQYELTPDQLECLRDLASRLPTGETAEGEILVQRHSADEDPTSPRALASINKPKAVTTTASKPANDYRKWTSANGKFQIEAMFVKFANGTVHLKRKDNGQVIQVPFAQLSETDQSFIKRRR